jgi:ribosome maturation factor RimP
VEKEAIIAELKNIISELVKKSGLVFVDMIYRRQGTGLFLGILLDRPEGGISLGECAKINREVSAKLDESDILEENYVLEVSSPGLDRPLKTAEDFLRCLNKQVRIFLNTAVEGKIEVQGIIRKADELTVYVGENGKTLEIPLSHINKGKQVIL